MIRKIDNKIRDLFDLVSNPIQVLFQALVGHVAVILKVMFVVDVF